MCDGSGSMEEVFKAAIDAGYRSFGISSHAPLPFPTKWSMKEDCVEDYRGEFQRLREIYEDSISLHLGIELDYVREVMNAHAPVVEKIAPEYIIGSVHIMGQLDDGQYWTIDGSIEEYARGVEEQYGGDIKRAVLDYFRLNMEMIDQGGIDILGHSDKISMPLLKQAYSLDECVWYKRGFEDLLDLCKEQHVIVEINTKSIDRYGVFFPNRSHFKQLKRFGVRVMVNTDCHRTNEIAIGLEEAYRGLLEEGIKSCVVRRGESWEDEGICLV